MEREAFMIPMSRLIINVIDTLIVWLLLFRWRVVSSIQAVRKGRDYRREEEIITRLSRINKSGYDVRALWQRLFDAV